MQKLMSCEKMAQLTDSVVSCLCNVPSSFVSHSLDAFLQAYELAQAHEKFLRDENIRNHTHTNTKKDNMANWLPFFLTQIQPH